ncbi:MAG: response regulator transcription factor [Flavobacteriales bacterium]|nr:response regulator transcription factor [Flavobacteriales bacterium]MCB9190700.1 response regulator transcription factor [Flavobacteriales bacterium]
MDHPDTIRVAVFDDSWDRRESLSYLIDLFEDMECVGIFEDATDAVEKLRSCNPHVVLMDIEMPRTNGIEGVKAIKAAMPEVTVIMQTVFEDDDNLFNSIRAGASGYILKRDDPYRTIQAVREARNGGASMNAGMALKVLRFFQAQTTSEEVADESTKPSYPLTERERNILSLMVDGLSYKMIAGRENISYHTVNSHIRNIYDKLHVHSASEAVSKALREGLID